MTSLSTASIALFFTVFVVVDLIVSTATALVSFDYDHVDDGNEASSIFVGPSVKRATTTVSHDSSLVVAARRRRCRSGRVTIDAAVDAESADTMAGRLVRRTTRLVYAIQHVDATANGDLMAVALLVAAERRRQVMTTTGQPDEWRRWRADDDDEEGRLGSRCKRRAKCARQRRYATQHAGL